jgi:hypothetical protein
MRLVAEIHYSNHKSERIAYEILQSDKTKGMYDKKDYKTSEKNNAIFQKINICNRKISKSKVFECRNIF